MQKVKIIIVNYYSVKQIRVLLNSILRSKCDWLISAKIAVVENTLDIEQREKLKLLEQDFSGLNIELLFAEKNLGYFGGANFAFQKDHDIDCYDFVVLMNPDIEIVNVSSLSIQNISSEVGMVAANIVNQNGVAYNPYFVIQPTRQYWSRLFLISRSYWFYKIYESLHLLKKRYFSPVRETTNKKDDKLIYAGHGSVFIITRYALKKGFDFSYPGFLFLEEFFTAEQLKQKHLKTIYDKDIHFIHYEHHATGNRKSKKMFAYWKQSIGLFHALFQRGAS